MFLHVKFKWNRFNCIIYPIIMPCLLSDKNRIPKIDFIFANRPFKVRH